MPANDQAQRRGEEGRNCMDALKEIEAAWMEWSGYDTAPPGGGPALEKWEVFKAAWVAAKAHGEIQRERLEHLRDVEASQEKSN